MAYKSLLTVITRPEGLGHKLDAAILLASSYDAHLEVLCVATVQTAIGYDYMGANGALIQQVIDSAREKSEALEALVRTHLAAQDIRWSVDSISVPMGGLAETVAEQAQYSDLVVQTKPYSQSDPSEEEAVIEAALFEARVPVLVLADGQMLNIPGKRIVVAWNQSNEAMAAIRAAMPLLKSAEQVTVMIVDPAKLKGERSDPGGALSQMLSRHGVKAEVTVLAKTLPRFCDMLNRHALDRSADMVVMGAYGHSRLRESILGGATRGMLEQAEIPVLMAH